MAAQDKWIISLDLDTSGLTRGLANIRGQLDALGRPAGFSGGASTTYLSDGSGGAGVLGPGYVGAIGPGGGGGRSDGGVAAAQAALAGLVQSQIQQIRALSNTNRNSGFSGPIPLGPASTLAALPSRTVDRAQADIAGAARQQSALARQYTDALRQTVGYQNQITRSQQEVIAANRYAAAMIRRRADQSYNQVLAIAQPAPVPQPISQSLPVPVPVSQQRERPSVPLVIAPPAQPGALETRTRQREIANRPYVDNTARLIAVETGLIRALDSKSQALRAQTSIITSNLGRFASAENALIAAMEAKAAAVRDLPTPTLTPAAAVNAITSGTIPPAVAASVIPRALQAAPVSQTVIPRPQYERVRPQYVDSPTQGRVFQSQIDTEKVWDQFVESSKRFQPQVAQALSSYFNTDIAGARGPVPAGGRSDLLAAIGRLVPARSFEPIEPISASRLRFASAKALEYHPFLLDRINRIGSFSNLGIPEISARGMTQQSSKPTFVGYNDSFGYGSYTDSIFAKQYRAGLNSSPVITKTAYHEVAGHHLDYAALNASKDRYAATMSRVLQRYVGPYDKPEEVIRDALGPYAVTRNSTGRLSEVIPEAVANVYTAPRPSALALDLYQGVHNLVAPAPSLKEIERRRRVIAAADQSFLNDDIAGARVSNRPLHERIWDQIDRGRERRELQYWLEPAGAPRSLARGRGGPGTTKPYQVTTHMLENEWTQEIGSGATATAYAFPNRLESYVVRQETGTIARLGSLIDRTETLRQAAGIPGVEKLAAVDVAGRPITKFAPGQTVSTLRSWLEEDPYGMEYFTASAKQIRDYFVSVARLGLSGVNRNGVIDKNPIAIDGHGGNVIFNPEAGFTAIDYFRDRRGSYGKTALQAAETNVGLALNYQVQDVPVITRKGRDLIESMYTSAAAVDSILDEALSRSGIDETAAQRIVPGYTGPPPSRPPSQRPSLTPLSDLTFPLGSFSTYKLGSDFARQLALDTAVSDIAGARVQNRQRNREYLGQGVEATAYGFTDAFGKQLVERIFEDDFPSYLIDRRVEGLRRAADIPGAEQLVTASGRSVVTTRLPGRDLWDPLGVDPQFEQIATLTKTLRELGNRGVSIDAGAGNFLFEKSAGFGVIDFKPSNLSNEILARQNVGSGLATVFNALSSSSNLDIEKLYELRASTLDDIAGARANLRSYRNLPNSAFEELGTGAAVTAFGFTDPTTGRQLVERKAHAGKFGSTRLAALNATIGIEGAEQLVGYAGKRIYTERLPGKSLATVSLLEEFAPTMEQFTRYLRTVAQIGSTGSLTDWFEGNTLYDRYRGFSAIDYSKWPNTQPEEIPNAIRQNVRGAGFAVNQTLLRLEGKTAPESDLRRAARLVYNEEVPAVSQLVANPLANPDIAGARQNVRNNLAGTGLRAEQFLDPTIRDFFNPDEVNELIAAVDTLGQRAPAVLRQVVRSTERFWTDLEAQAQALVNYSSDPEAARALLGERGGIISPLTAIGQTDIAGRSSTAANTVTGRLLSGDLVSDSLRQNIVSDYLGATLGAASKPFALTLNPEALRESARRGGTEGIVNPSISGIFYHEAAHFAAGGAANASGVPEVLSRVRDVMRDYGLFEAIGSGNNRGVIGGATDVLPSALAGVNIAELISESVSAEVSGVGATPFTAAVFGAVNEGLLQSEDRERAAVDELTIAAERAAAALQYLATATAAQVRALGVPQSVAQQVVGSRPTTVDQLAALPGVGPVRQAALLENAAKAQEAIAAGGGSGGGTPPRPPSLPSGPVPPDSPFSGNRFRNEYFQAGFARANTTSRSGAFRDVGQYYDFLENRNGQARIEAQLARSASRRQLDAERGPLSAAEQRYRRGVAAAQRSIEINDISGLNNAQQEALYRGFRPVQPGRGIESEIWQEASSSRSGSTARAEALRSQLRQQQFTADPIRFSNAAQSASVLEDQLASGVYTDQRTYRRAQRAAGRLRSQYGLTNEDVMFGRYQAYERYARQAASAGGTPPPPPPGFNDWAAAGAPTPGSFPAGAGGGRGGRGGPGGPAFEGDRGGNWFQRIRQGIRSDTGLGGFFGGGALSVLRYGVPSMLMYGAVSGIGNSLREAEEFQYNLARMESQLEALGDSGTTNIDAVKNSILDLARNTGVAADQITEMQLRIRGAFAGEEIGGLSGEALVESQTRAATELSVVTKLPVEQVNNELTAASLAFDATFREIGDVATGLEARSGVPSGELINFLGDVAPVAEESGFSLEEISSIGTLVLQRSGRSGTALAESFNRILPAVAQNKDQLLEIASREEALGTPEFIDAVRSSDVSTVITTLGQNFAALNKESKDFVINLLGGRREAQALIPAFANSSKLNEFLKEASDSSGSLEERFQKLRETLTNTLARLGEQVRSLTTLLLEAGLADIFETALTAVGLLVGGITPLLSLMASFNESLGGIPGKLLSIIALFGLLRLGVQKISPGGFLSGFLGGAGPFGGRGFTAGSGSRIAAAGGGLYGGFAAARESAATAFANARARNFSAVSNGWYRWNERPTVFGNQFNDPRFGLPAAGGAVGPFPGPATTGRGAFAVDSAGNAARLSRTARLTGAISNAATFIPTTASAVSQIAATRGVSRFEALRNITRASIPQIDSPFLSRYRDLRAPNEFTTRRLAFPRDEVAYTTPGAGRFRSALGAATAPILDPVRQVAATRGVTTAQAFRGIARASLPSLPSIGQAGTNIAGAASGLASSPVGVLARGAVGVGVSAFGSAATFLAANPFMGIIALAGIYSAINAQVEKAKQELEELTTEIREGNTKARNLEGQGDRTAVAVRYGELNNQAIAAFEEQGNWDRGWRTILGLPSIAETYRAEAETFLFDPDAQTRLSAVMGSGLEQRARRLALGNVRGAGRGRTQTPEEYRRASRELADYGLQFQTNRAGIVGLVGDETVDALRGIGDFLNPFDEGRTDNGRKQTLTTAFLENERDNEIISNEAFQLGRGIIEAATGTEDGQIDATVFRAATRANAVEALTKIVDDTGNAAQREQARNLLEAIDTGGLTDDEYGSAAAELEDAQLTDEELLTKNLGELSQLQDAGYLSFADYLTQGRQLLSDRAKIIFGGKNTAATDEQIAGFLKEQSDFNARVAAARQQEVQNALQEAQIFGASEDEINLRTIDLNLQTIRNPEIKDPQALRNAALAIIESSKNLYAELLSRAGSAEEAQNILNQANNDPVIAEALAAVNKSRIMASAPYIVGAAGYQALRSDPNSDLLNRDIGPDTAFSLGYADFIDDGQISPDTAAFYLDQAAQINEEYQNSVAAGEPIDGQQLQNMRNSMRFLMSIMQLFGIASEEYDPALVEGIGSTELPPVVKQQFEDSLKKDAFEKRASRRTLEGQVAASYAARGGNEIAAARAVADAAKANLDAFAEDDALKYNEDGSYTDEYLQAVITWNNAEAAWMNAKAQDAQAFVNLAISEAQLRGDTVGAAIAQLNGAQQRLRDAAPGSPEAAQAQADVNTSLIAIRNAETQKSLKNYDLLAAKGNRSGALNLSLVALARAQEQRRRAVGDEIVDADIAIAEAEKGVADAYRSRVEALYGLKKIQDGPDPLKGAQTDVKMLQQLLGDAKRAGDLDAQIEIQGRLIEAERAAADAQRAVRQSMLDLRRAELEAMDDDVGAARVNAEQQRQILADMIARGDGQAAIIGQQAQVVAADRAVRDAVLQDKLDEYQYLLDTDKITKGQYINYLTALKNTLDPSTDQFKELEVTLKRLKDDISGDLQANLPTSLSLPTLYEVRRLSQTPSNFDQGGFSGYQDNRNVTINIRVDDAYDPEMIDIIKEAVVGQSSPQGYRTGRIM